MPLFDFTQYNCRSLLVFGLSFWKLAEVPLEELYLSVNQLTQRSEEIGSSVARADAKIA